MSSPEAATKRDLRLDLLRGFCVVVMVADHIGGESSWLYVITAGNRFFTSAAEGFVLISGITMGIVYRGVIDREGLTSMLRRVMRRAGFLYLLTVSLTIVFSIVSMLLNTPWSQYAQPAGPIEFALGVGTMHRSYQLVDVLLLYTLLVFASPPLLYFLATGRTKLISTVKVHGVEHDVAWVATATRVGRELKATATTTVHFADFGMERPSVALVLSVQDDIRVSVKLRAEQA